VANIFNNSLAFWFGFIWKWLGFVLSLLLFVLGCCFFGLGFQLSCAHINYALGNETTLGLMKQIDPETG
jgi:hypothetical protein